MPKAWSCIDFPELHGSFLQAGLDTLSKLCGAVQPEHRYACPICLSIGSPGWMRPSEEPEAARIAAEQGA